MAIVPRGSTDRSMKVLAGQTMDVEFIEGVPEYDSFADAVAAAKSREGLAQSDNESLEGEIIVSYSFSGRVLALRTNAGSILSVYVGSGSIVEWDVTAGAWERTSDDIPAVIRVRFPSGREHEWRWKELLDRIVGHRFASLSPSETAVSLYVHGCPDLRISALRVAQSGDVFLFVGEE